MSPKYSLTQLLVLTGVGGLTFGIFLKDSEAGLPCLLVALGFFLSLRTSAVKAIVVIILACLAVTLFWERQPLFWGVEQAISISSIPLAAYTFFRFVFWVASTLRTADLKRMEDDSENEP